MKKTVSIILIACIVTLLCSCSNSITSPTNKEKSITAEQMLSFIEVVEFTEDNWRDYFFFEKLEEAIPMRIKAANSFACAFYNSGSLHTYIRLDCSFNDSENERKWWFEVYHYKDTGYNMKDTKDYIDHMGIPCELDKLSFVESSDKLIRFNIPEDQWIVNESGDAYIIYENERIYKDTLVTSNAIANLLHTYFAQ